MILKKSQPHTAQQTGLLHRDLSVSDAATLYALVLLALFPIFVEGHLYTGLLNKRYYFYLNATAAGVLLAALCLLDTLHRKGLAALKSLRRPTWPQIFLTAYALWNIFSGLISEYGDIVLPGMSRRYGLVTTLLYCVTFLLISAGGRPRKCLLYAFSASAIVVGAIALLQSLGVRLIYADGESYWNSLRLTTFGYNDFVSGYLSLALPVLIAGYAFLPGKWTRLALPAIFLLTYTHAFIDVNSGRMGLIAAALILIPFLCGTSERLTRTLHALTAASAGAFLDALLQCSDNRGPALTISAKTIIYFLFIIFALAAACLIRRRKPLFARSEATIRKRLFITEGTLICAGLICIFLYDGENQLLKEASELLHGQLSDEAGTCRGYIWKNSLHIIAEHPIAGSGPGTFAGEFTPYNAGYGQFYPDTIVDMAHNEYLQIACCTGLVGLGLYLGFLGSLLGRGLRAARRRPEVVILIAGIAGYSIHSVFLNSILITAPIFWTLAGLLDSMCGDNRRKPSAS